MLRKNAKHRTKSINCKEELGKREAEENIRSSYVAKNSIRERMRGKRHSNGKRGVDGDRREGIYIGSSEQEMNKPRVPQIMIKSEIYVDLPSPSCIHQPPSDEYHHSCLYKHRGEPYRHPRGRGIGVRTAGLSSLKHSGGIPSSRMFIGVNVNRSEYDPLSKCSVPGYSPKSPNDFPVNMFSTKATSKVQENVKREKEEAKIFGTTFIPIIKRFRGQESIQNVNVEKDNEPERPQERREMNNTSVRIGTEGGLLGEGELSNWGETNNRWDEDDNCSYTFSGASTFYHNPNSNSRNLVINFPSHSNPINIESNLNDTYTKGDMKGEEKKRKKRKKRSQLDVGVLYQPPRCLDHPEGEGSTGIDIRRENSINTMNNNINTMNNMNNINNLRVRNLISEVNRYTPTSQPEEIYRVNGDGIEKELHPESRHPRGKRISSLYRSKKESVKLVNGQILNYDLPLLYHSPLLAYSASKSFASGDNRKGEGDSKSGGKDINKYINKDINKEDITERDEVVTFRYPLSRVQIPQPDIARHRGKHQSIVERSFVNTRLLHHKTSLLSPNLPIDKLRGKHKTTTTTAILSPHLPTSKSAINLFHKHPTSHNLGFHLMQNEALTQIRANNLNKSAIISTSNLGIDKNTLDFSQIVNPNLKYILKKNLNNICNNNQLLKAKSNGKYIQMKQFLRDVHKKQIKHQQLVKVKLQSDTAYDSRTNPILYLYLGQGCQELGWAYKDPDVQISKSKLSNKYFLAS